MVQAGMLGKWRNGYKQQNSDNIIIFRQLITVTRGTLGGRYSQGINSLQAECFSVVVAFLETAVSLARVGKRNRVLLRHWSARQ